MKMPVFAVTRLAADGTGDDIAWFFEMKDAENYIAAASSPGKTS